MASAADAHCPLCGISILSIGSHGEILGSDLHPIPMHIREGDGEGYMLCDDCGSLAELSNRLTLN